MREMRRRQVRESPHHRRRFPSAHLAGVIARGQATIAGSLFYLYLKSLDPGIAAEPDAARMERHFRQITAEAPLRRSSEGP